MKLTLYNNNFEFSEKLTQEYIDIFVPNDYPEFDVEINEIKNNHPFAYGWLEGLSQSKISNLFYWTTFTHIKFEK